MTAPTGPRHDLEIRVVGDASRIAHALFGDEAECSVEPVATTIVVKVRSEGEVTELCHRVRDYGLQLIALRRLAQAPTDLSADGPER